MTNISLQDDGIPQLMIPLSKTTLYAGERMDAATTVRMGTTMIELTPTAQYTVRGIESKASAAQPVTVEYVEVDLRLEVEKYPATAEGTLFRVTLINAGSHPMTDIRLMDEIGSRIVEGIALEPWAERTVSYMVPSAVSSGTVRYVSFEANGIDCLGSMVTVKSPTAYEVLPFVDSDQVRLKLSVNMPETVQNDDGSYRLKLMFEIRNDSLVPITNAVIMEGDYFKGVVNEYAFLSTGTTSFEKEFVVPAGTRSLTFALTAMDPAQTQYASAPVTLDLSSQAAPKPTSQPAIKPGKTVDITGTIYDTERYYRVIRMGTLIVVALTLMFLLLSVIFRVAELNLRRWLPKESVPRPFGRRKTSTGPIPVRKDVDPVHDQFGYMQPAKLRYMDRTDRLPVVDQEDDALPPSIPAQTTGSFSTTSVIPPVAQRSKHGSRREGDITAVPIHKERPRPVMLSADRTMPFAPVHEGQEEETVTKETTAAQSQSVVKTGTSVSPRVIETRPAPKIIPKRKLEIVRVTPS